MILKKKSFLSAIAIAAAMFCSPSVCALADTTNDDYLHTDGSKIFDQYNNEVRLTGVAWFGYETPEAVLHGLWSQSCQNMVDTVADRGFNLIRIPLSVETALQRSTGEVTEARSVDFNTYPELKGMGGEQVLDYALNYCKEKGVKVMLDMHRVYTGSQSPLWADRGFTTEDFETAWRYLARKYKNDDTVIACDIFNEPHGKAYRAETNAKWDESEDENNWKYEAERVGNIILDENPNLLIMVEGVETYPREGFKYGDAGEHCYEGGWWGGNLMGVKEHPIDFGTPERNKQVVYSPHDYGPGVSQQSWFQKDFNTETLKDDIWRKSWLYIKEDNIAPILIGEWGGRLDGGDNQKWLECMAKLIVDENLNHTFWCLNPNSGDTGGVYKDDLRSVDEEKYALIKPTLWQNEKGEFIGLDHEVNLGKNGTHVRKNGEVVVPPTTPPVVKLAGDVNGDAIVSIGDYTLLKKYINTNGDGIVINKENSDINEDGNVNFLDLLALKALV